MATRGKKISEQTLAASLDGNEIIPFAKNGANGAVKASKIKEWIEPDLSKLDSLPTATELDAALTAKQDKLVNSADITVGEDDKLSVTEEAKRKLFVDMWTQCYDCQYDATKEKPFTCNGLDLTYLEAIDVYNAPRVTYNDLSGYARIPKVKTLILSSTGTSGKRVSYSSAFRAFYFLTLRLSADSEFAYCKDMAYAFYDCVYLTTIKGNIRFSEDTVASYESAFEQCNELQFVNLHSVKYSLSFAASKLLSFDSIQYLVTNAANTSPITVTLHPDAYARLTDELITQATEKQITFATPT